MATGTVLWFKIDKHYGFIAPDDGPEQVMLHERQLADQRDATRLGPGVRVSYSVRQSDRGMRASDVRLLPPEDDCGSDCSDVLTVAQFRDEVSAVLADAVSRLEEIARKHGWVD